MADEDGDGFDDVTGAPVAASTDPMSALQALLDNPLGTMPQGSTPTAYVWMGDSAGRPLLGGSHGAIYGKSTGYAPVAADTAVLAFQGWSGKELQTWKQLLVKNGYEPQSYADLASSWESAVAAAQVSWTAYEQGVIDKPMTPQEALRKMAERDSELFPSQGEGGVETQTYSQTATSVDHLSAQEGRGQAYDAAQAFLGRAPGKREVAGYTSGYNATASDNPTVTSSSGSSTTNSNTNHNDSTSNSTTTGGIDQETYQREWAQSQDDYSEYTAATKFMDALVSALGQQVGG